MSTEAPIELKLTREEAKALAVAADLGMRSGKLLDALESFDADMNCVNAIVKLRQALGQES